MHLESNPNESPFRIDLSFRDPFRKTVFGLLRGPLEKVLRLRTLSKMWDEVRLCDAGPVFTNRALGLLNVDGEVWEADRQRIPTQGPVIVVANHPFGAVEGLLLASLLASVRDDVKILANYFLARIPQMRPFLIAVDPFGTRRATRRNMRPLKEALAWVRGGGMLGVFPAGAVSHLHWRRREVADPRWNESVGRFIRQAKAPVLPVFFDGRNSNLFQLVGMVHPRLRTAMLPRELLNKCNKRIPVRVGNVIPNSKFQGIAGDRDLIEYLRLRTYLLSERARTVSVSVRKSPLGSTGSSEADIVTAQDPARLLQDVQQLPPEALLATKGKYSVYHATKEQIPHMFREIGRLREITFREAGEGTGLATDLDRFDDYYVHLFVWNGADGELVGAYRLGKTDEIVEQQGIKGLYTYTLFHYGRRLLRQISPALELGRSFVRPEYQREYVPLHLLWKGIGQFLVRNPRYKRLFGPVSINSQYHSASQRLLVRFLRANRFAGKLAGLVKPRLPLKAKRARKWYERASVRLVRDVEEMSDLIAEIEADQQGVPVLLRHYLRLGGKLLGFNIDPDFSDVLDGLILVDLTQTDRTILEKYIGRDEVTAFLTYRQERPGRKRARRRG